MAKQELASGLAVAAVIAAGTTSLSPVPAHASDVWVRKADMPTGRLALGAAAVDGELYAMGGYFGANSPPAYDVEAYDPVTDNWERRASMQTPRRRFGVAVVDGLIYAIGGNEAYGWPPLATVEVYDPVADRWSEAPDMPTPRLGLTASAVDGKIYAIGGGAGASLVVEAYDPATLSWTRKADSPVPWTLHAVAVVDGQIYVFGGGLPGMPAGREWVYRYDPVSDSWLERSPLPQGAMLLAGAALHGRVYALGGRRSGMSAFVEPEPTVFEYDPVADTWAERAPMPTPRVDLRAAAIDGKRCTPSGDPSSSRSPIRGPRSSSSTRRPRTSPSHRRESNPPGSTAVGVGEKRRSIMPRRTTRTPSPTMKTWRVFAALAIAAQVACGGSGGPAGPSAVSPSAPVDPALVGTWVGPIDVTNGVVSVSATMTMTLRANGAVRVDGDSPRLHPFTGTWQVSEGQFLASGTDTHGTALQFQAPRSTSQLDGTVSGDGGITGTFSTTRQ